MKAKGGVDVALELELNEEILLTPEDVAAEDDDHQM